MNLPQRRPVVIVMLADTTTCRRCTRTMDRVVVRTPGTKPVALVDCPTCDRPRCQARLWGNRVCNEIITDRASTRCDEHRR